MENLFKSLCCQGNHPLFKQSVEFMVICLDAICQKGGMSQNAEAFLALKSRFLIQDLSVSMAPSAKSLFIGR